MNEEIAWFDTYLFETYEPKNEAFKKDSPLASKLHMNDFAIKNGYFGIDSEGVLYPEMVSLGDDTIRIARFELTNAQYQSFKPDFEYMPANGNHPVTGLSEDDVISYLTWINEETGGKYRLPNEKEAKALHSKAHKGGAKENTLNYWAGYEITVNEVESLTKKMEELKTSLIMPVGSFKPIKIKEQMIYDIGGNASEYYTGNDKIQIYGYSAYDYVDPMDESMTSNSKYTGIRLIQEK